MSDAGHNLVHDPWIPIGGRTVSVEEALLDAHNLPGWPDGEPGLAEVLMRLLVPMAYRITGIDDPDISRTQFATLQRQLLDVGRFDHSKVEDYLSRHSDRFWLLDPPSGGTLFAQDASLDKVTIHHPSAKAVTSWASGNSPALGPHAPCGTIPQDLAACQVLILRSFAWGGTHTPHPDHKGKGKFLHGPLRGTMSVHPLGATLAATLIGHLVPLPADGTEFGRPFWEEPPPANQVAAHRGRAGMLEQIAGRQDKTMLLRTDTAGEVTGFTIAEGPGLDRDLFCRDPYLLVEPEGKTRKPRSGRAFWRESEALLAQTGESERLTAPILEWATGEGAISGTYEPGHFSWAAVTHRGDQSKDLEWNYSVFPDLLHLFAPEASRRARAFMERANDAEGKMIKQVAKVWHAARLMPSKAADKSAVYAVARTEFWRLAESDFWDTATSQHASIGVDAPWMNRLRSHALAGYDAATATLLHDRRTHMVVEESRRWVSRWARSRADTPNATEEND